MRAPASTATAPRISSMRFRACRKACGLIVGLQAVQADGMISRQFGEAGKIALAANFKFAHRIRRRRFFGQSGFKIDPHIGRQRTQQDPPLPLEGESRLSEIAAVQNGFATDLAPQSHASKHSLFGARSRHDRNEVHVVEMAADEPPVFVAVTRRGLQQRRHQSRELHRSDFECSASISPLGFSRMSRSAWLVGRIV